MRLVVELSKDDWKANLLVYCIYYFLIVIDLWFSLVGEKTNQLTNQLTKNL